METDGIWALVGVGVLCAAGFVAGLARLKSRRAPAIAGSVIVAGYLMLLAVTGIWVAACPGCTSHISYDSARPVDLIMAFFWGALFTTGIIMFILLGAGVSTAVGRLREGARR